MVGPLTNIDRMVAVLRQRLEERSATSRAAQANPKTPSRTAQSSAAVTAFATGAPDDLRRALVHHLLADAFGPKFVNMPQFQNIVMRVSAMLEEDTRSAGLITKLLDDMK